MRSLCSPISSKTRAPSPRMTGTLEAGYQTTLPKPRRPVKSEIDFIPIRMEGNVVGSSDGEEPLRRLGDDAGVGDVELESRARRERRGEGMAASCSWPVWSTSELSVATVKATSWPGDADALPIERRGNLQRDMIERGFAVVADGDGGADGDLMRGG